MTSSRERIALIVPPVGESVTEASVVRWFKQPGEFVHRDEPVVEIETDYATVEVAAPVSGVLVARAANANDRVAVGATLGAFEYDPSAQPAPPRPLQPPPPRRRPEAAPLAAAREVDLADHGDGAAGSKPKDRVAIVLPQLSASSASGEVVRWLKRPGEFVAREEPVIEIACDKVTVEVPAPVSGVVVAHAVGEGAEVAPGATLGEIVEDPSGRPPPRPLPPPLPPPPPPRVAPPPRPLRDAPRYLGESTAHEVRAARRARSEAATLTLVREVDLAELVALAAPHAPAAAGGAPGVVCAVIVRAVVDALDAVPALASGAAGPTADAIAVVRGGDGAATGRERVWVLRAVRTAPLDALAAALDATEVPPECRPATEPVAPTRFAVRDLGAAGVLLATPRLDSRHRAVLGVHAVVARPIAVGGAVVVHPMMLLALTYDAARVSDGDAAGFLARVAEALARPAALLARA